MKAALPVFLISGLTLVAASVPERKLPRDGFDLRYRIYGHGAPVLILSGGPGFDCDYLEPVATALAATNEAILVDLRGTGGSRPPKIDRSTISLKMVLGDLEDLRKSLGYERWIVLGHSAGAALAMNYAIEWPDHVAGLVLVDSGPARQALMGAMMDNIFLRFTPAEAEAARTHPSLEGLMAGYFFDREKAKAFMAGFRPDSYHEDAGRLLAEDEMKPGMDMRPALRRLQMPALIVAGRQDPLDPGMQYEIHESIKNSRIVLLDRCGHFAWLEQPDGLYKEIQMFLRDHH